MSKMDNSQFGLLNLSEKNIPHNLEAEQSVLGAVILDPSCISDLIQILKPECFYKPVHRELFSVMVGMFTRSESIDIVSLMEQCLLADVFENEQSAKVYLTQLAQTVPIISNVSVYAKIVVDKYYVRALITAASDILNTATENSSSAADLLDFAEQRIYDIRKGKDSVGIKKIDEIIVSAYDHLQKISGEDKELYAPASTGYAPLDTIITGLNKSDLVIIAARPGVGKTAFAVNIATNVAKKTKKDVVIFNLEMGAEQVVLRMLSSESGINSKDLLTGNLNEKDGWVKLAMAAQSLSQLNIYIDDTANLTVAQMKAKLRKVKNLGCIVIDYLQLMTSSVKSDNRVQQVSEMTRNLKIMAKELNVPVITCSQLSRNPENRTDKRPNLSDLRESGSIEQDADVIMFLYREAYHDRNSENQNDAECIVGKNRHGETGTVQLYWDGLHTRYVAIEKKYEN